ncbi:MAG: flagellar biosynthesis protein FlgC [Rhodospirillales bacterium]|nr:flagellar biosynthesis protein FlgC [Rhodospirillales bacterium]MCB9996324.1 flagellar biosynthesis protein FlgC [Rhodospirillales bacterium]
MINTIQIALSGLFASQKKADASAANIANLTTAGSIDDPGNAPYSARTTVQSTITDSDGNALGVKSDVIPKKTPFVPAYDPDSPLANEDGIIGVPNVDLAEEAVNLNLSKYTFQANLKVIETISELNEDLLGVFDDEA